MSCLTLIFLGTAPSGPRHCTLPFLQYTTQNHTLTTGLAYYFWGFGHPGLNPLHIQTYISDGITQRRDIALAGKNYRNRDGQRRAESGI